MTCDDRKGGTAHEHHGDCECCGRPGRVYFGGYCADCTEIVEFGATEKGAPPPVGWDASDDYDREGNAP